MKRLYETLSIDCQKCSGLCCVALYYAKSDGFPNDKEPGIPCKHLLPDFRCHIHDQLEEKKLKGCLSYDCFGAGQKVTGLIYKGEDWRSRRGDKDEIFQAFHKVTQLHQMLWYLLEAYRVMTDKTLQKEIQFLIKENEHMTQLSPSEIVLLDIELYRERVNAILKSIMPQHPQKVDYIGKNFKGINLDGENLSMCFLIAANLEGCSLKGTNFLGADMRDANIKNTDLSQSIFLTQMQINTAKGNKHTQLPKHLSRPSTW